MFFGTSNELSTKIREMGPTYCTNRNERAAEVEKKYVNILIPI